MNPRRPAAASSSSMLPSLTELLELRRDFGSSAGALPEDPSPGGSSGQGPAGGRVLAAVVLGAGAFSAALSQVPIEAPRCGTNRAAELAAHGATVTTRLSERDPPAALQEIALALGLGAHTLPTDFRGNITEPPLTTAGVPAPVTHIPPIPQAQTPVESPELSPRVPPGVNPHSIGQRRGAIRRVSPSPVDRIPRRPPANR